jgi:hypothetical protein
MIRTNIKSRFPSLVLAASFSWLLFATISWGNPIADYPHPNKNPQSSLMFEGADPNGIDFTMLPVLNGQHAVISKGDSEWHYRLHNYLTHFDGRYWCMWSHGPFVEDKPTQHIRFATSEDGIKWTEPGILVESSSLAGFRHIARGFWLRGDGKLRALASHDEALKDGHTHFFGKSLDLRSYVWNAPEGRWEFEGIVFDDTINNFPPKKLKTGDWMMTRRTSSRTISFLVGGQYSISDWKVIPYSIKDREDGMKPEEPFWYELPDGNLVALARDNAKSGRLLRSFSVDDGNIWSSPVRTNFPDATSKFNVLKTTTGLYVLINNANPKHRNPLCISVSRDGLVYRSLHRLPIPEQMDGVDWEKESSQPNTKYESFQYPHVIEHDGALLVAFSRKKQTVEVLKISLLDIEAIF